RRAFVKAHRCTEERPVSAPPPRKLPFAVTLRGEGGERAFALFAHQIAGKQGLSDALRRPSSEGVMVVLPTGAGKTETAAEWLLERMEKEKQVRVLWLAHRNELLDQTLLRFRASAIPLPKSFERRARAVHSEGSAASTLTEKGLDLAVVSIS